MFKHAETGGEAPRGREVRLVAARILTPAGWIVGKMHVAADWRMINFMNNVPDFFSLADVIIEGRPKVVPLFSLHRAAIQFVVVETQPEKELDAGLRNQVEHPISCLLQNGSLSGVISVLRGVRLSDHLSRQKGFVILKDAHFHLRNPWENRVIDHREPLVLLNPQAVVGVSEWSEDV
jgi:hypothetical protein